MDYLTWKVNGNLYLQFIAKSDSFNRISQLPLFIDFRLYAQRFIWTHPDWKTLLHSPDIDISNIYIVLIHPAEKCRRQRATRNVVDLQTHSPCETG